MIDWKQKLTSRKFWMAVIGFVTGLLTYIGIGVEKAEQIGSLILMAASVLAYIIGEGLADAAGAASPTYDTWYLNHDLDGLYGDPEGEPDGEPDGEPETTDNTTVE